MAALKSEPGMDFLGWEREFTKQEMCLLELFFVANEYRYNPGNFEKIWHDEDGNLCVRYQGGMWWHYNVSTSEWW